MNPLLPELPKEDGVILTRRYNIEWCNEVDKVFSTFVTDLGELKARPQLNGEINTIFPLKFKEILEDLWDNILGCGLSAFDCDLEEEVPLKRLIVPGDSLLGKALSSLQDDSKANLSTVPVASAVVGEKRKSCEGLELSLENPLVSHFLSAASQGVNVTPSKVFRGEQNSEVESEREENVGENMGFMGNLTE
jgi:hypothetical protein